MNRKCWDGLEVHQKQNHSRKRNLKSGMSFRNWIQKCEKKGLPKVLIQCHITEIWNERSCGMHFSTVVHKVMNWKFEYLKSKQKYRHLKCGRGYSATLTSYMIIIILTYRCVWPQQKLSKKFGHTFFRIWLYDGWNINVNKKYAI